MRQEHRPVSAGRAWPAKLGPLSKALAVGVAAVATEAGLSRLRQKIGAEDRSSKPAVRSVGSTSRASSRESLLVFVRPRVGHRVSVVQEREGTSGGEEQQGRQERRDDG